MPAKVVGMLDWELSRDKEGHRDYNVSWLVKADTPTDGPGWAMVASGMPLIGSYWQFGTEVDPWAFCSPESTAKSVLSREPGYYWVVDQLFTTRPIKRCQDSSIEDPLNEPYRINGSFNTYSEEAFFDRFGRPIISSSFEPYKGPQTEFDAGRPVVTIGFNFPSIPIPIFAPVVHVVNDAPLWGLPARTIKLSGMRWSRQLWGTCSYYYSIDYDFEIKYDTWDRNIPDQGRRHLKPGGDATKITDFILYKDKNQEYTECFLDGSGNIAETLEEVKVWNLQKYSEANLLTLGIPADLGA